MLDVWTNGEDVDVDAAEAPWMETRARTRACGVAGDDAEDAVAGEGEATLTRTRLGADARPADADDGEAIAGVDVVGVRDSWWRSFAAAVPVLLWPSWASLQRMPGMLRAANLL